MTTPAGARRPGTASRTTTATRKTTTSRMTVEERGQAQPRQRVQRGAAGRGKQLTAEEKAEMERLKEMAKQARQAAKTSTVKKTFLKRGEGQSAYKVSQARSRQAAAAAAAEAEQARTPSPRRSPERGRGATTARRPPGAATGPPGAARRPPGAATGPPGTARGPPGTARRPPASARGPPGTARGPPGTARRPPGAARGISTTPRRPPLRGAATQPRGAAAARGATPAQVQQVVLEVPVEIVISPTQVSPGRQPARVSPAEGAAAAPPGGEAPVEVVQTLQEVLAEHERIEREVYLRHLVRQQRFRRRFMTDALAPVGRIDPEQEEREIEEEVQRLLAQPRLEVPGGDASLLEQESFPDESYMYSPSTPDFSPGLREVVQGPVVPDDDVQFLDAVSPPRGVRSPTPSPGFQVPQPPSGLDEIEGMLWQCKLLLTPNEYEALLRRIEACADESGSDIESIFDSDYDTEEDESVGNLLPRSPLLVPARPYSPYQPGEAARELWDLVG